MVNKKKKNKISSKIPKQKYPFDSKIPKEKIPKQRLDDIDLIPPKKQKRKKESQLPARSHLRSTSERKNSSEIPKQKIPKSKIPSQDKLKRIREPNYIPAEKTSKTKEKKEETPPSRDKDRFSEIEGMESRPLPMEEKKEKKERESPAASQIEEVVQEKIPKQKVPTQKYPSQTKLPKQKKPK